MKTSNGKLTFGLLIALVLLIVMRGGVSADTPNSDSPLGANLHIFDSWSSEYTLVDVFKQSGTWRAPVDGAWHELEPDEIDLDEQGWPRSLVNPQDGTKYAWIGSLMFEGMKGHYPEGEYTVLYEGEGTLQYEQDAVRVESSELGKDVVVVNPDNSHVGFFLKIVETDPEGTGNYIRNIRVIMPEHEESTAPTFHPTFIENIQSYKVLRFMDWMRTNWSVEGPMRSGGDAGPVAEWSHPLHDATSNPYYVHVDASARSLSNGEEAEWEDRPKMTDARYSTTNGVPLELMIELSNEIDADAWFNMPHHASDEYMLQFALMVRNRLEANRHVYIELSNEVWNGGINSAGQPYGFYQAAWFQQKGMEEWPDSPASALEKGLNYYGKRTAEMCNIWELAFGAQADRIVCVIGTQAANPWIGEQMLDCPLWSQGPCHEHNVDAVAIAPYFGQHIGQQTYQVQVKEWTMQTNNGLDELFAELATGSELDDTISRTTLNKAKENITLYANVANTRNIDLVAYEGGQHLVGVGAPQWDASITELFGNANRDPRMANLYTEYYAHWRAAGGKMFMHYASLGAYSQWGNWGAQEFADSVGMPKISANLAFINSNSCDWATCRTPISYVPTAVTLNGTAATANLQLLPILLVGLLLSATVWLKRS